LLHILVWQSAGQIQVFYWVNYSLRSAQRGRAATKKRKSRFDHEGHEEHEVYEKKYRNPSWPSWSSWWEYLSSRAASMMRTIRKFAQGAQTLKHNSAKDTRI